MRDRLQRGFGGGLPYDEGYDSVNSSRQLDGEEDERDPFRKNQ